MARPAPDASTIRAEMLDTAEALLTESGGQRLVMSDIARHLGMSQSYAHRFFPTKHDLVGGLAARWFEAVETKGAEIIAGSGSAPERLRRLVLATLEIKRDRFDENPQLYLAYMDLARDHMPLVISHAGVLRGQIRDLVSEIVAPQNVEAALELTEDATMRFRVPQMIAQYRPTATHERANAVVNMVLRELATMG